MFRSVTSRLVFFYCLLLVLLGGAFLLFTALSFQHYTRETVTAALAARTQEIWDTSQGLLGDPDRLANIIERRFAPESQDRFIRIRAGDRLIYMSGNPVERDFSAYGVPLQFHAAVGDFDGHDDRSVRTAEQFREQYPGLAEALIVALQTGEDKVEIFIFDGRRK